MPPAKKTSAQAKRKGTKRPTKVPVVWIAPNLDRITKGEAGRRGLTDSTTGYYLGLADLALKGQNSAPAAPVVSVSFPVEQISVEPAMPQPAFPAEAAPADTTPLLPIQAKAPAKRSKPPKLGLPKPPKVKLLKPAAPPSKPKPPKLALPKTRPQPKPPRLETPHRLGPLQTPRPPRLSLPKPPRRRG